MVIKGWLTFASQDKFSVVSRGAPVKDQVVETGLLFFVLVACAWPCFIERIQASFDSDWLLEEAKFVRKVFQLVCLMEMFRWRVDVLNVVERIKLSLESPSWVWVQVPSFQPWSNVRSGEVDCRQPVSSLVGMPGLFKMVKWCCEIINVKFSLVRE